MWTHVAVTFDGATIKYYKNGTLMNSQANSNAMATTTDALNIGSYGNGTGGFYTGTLDEVKIYDAIITADQVKLDYNQGASQVLGSTSDKTGSGYEGGNATAAQEYCIPGDSTSCNAPVGRWDFEEGNGTTTYDSSGNSNTGTFINSPTWASGKNGKGVSFNGTTQYITAGTNVGNFAAAQPFTVEAWIYPTALGSTNRGIVSREDATFFGWRTAINNSNQFTMVVLSNGTNYRISNTAVLSTNRWYHVVGVWNGTSATTYLNGALDSATLSSGTVGTITSSSNTLQIGHNVPTDGYFGGTIDNVRVFDYARSAAQVAWDYNRGGPVAWWKFDECQGTSLGDSSGNSLTGTWNGTGAGVTTVGNCIAPTGPWYNGSGGKVNSSLSFDGTDDYVSCTDAACGGTSKLDLGSGDFTVSAWVKTTDTDGYLVSKGNSGSQYSWGLYTGSGNMSLILWNSAEGTYASTSSSGTSYNDNNWHHVVGTWTASGTSVKIYVDGVLKNSSSSTTGSLITDSTANVNIGRRGDSVGYLQGLIDDVRIYKYALTLTQINSIRNNGGAATFAPLTGRP